MQSDANGKWRMVMTLPEAMMLGSSERKAIERHVGALEKVLSATPAESAASEAETLVLVSKLMLALPGQKTGEAGAEASGEAYCAALDDLPPWAVAAAIRKWYRGDVPAPPVRSMPHNFSFRPAPATLRSLAFSEAHAVRGRMLQLQALLSAEKRVEYSDEHRLEMLTKLQGVMPGRQLSEAAE
jgi:hypothetical protein